MNMVPTVISPLLMIGVSVAAQPTTIGTEQLFGRLESTGRLWSLESLPPSHQWQEKCGPGSHDLYCETKLSKEYWSLVGELRNRADKGDALAVFYTGLLAYQGAKKVDVAGSRSFLNALDLFKSSCASGVYYGCFNVGAMLRDGDAGVLSGSAAAEWFYKAGIGHLSLGNRESGFQALDEIQRFDRNHPLGKRLQVKLEKGAP